MTAELHPSHRSEILFAIGMLLVLVFAYVARHVLLMIYVSALFAVVIGPAIDAVRRVHIGRWRPSRGLAILIILIAALGVLALFFTFALPPIFNDVKGFAADLPRRTAELRQKLGNSPIAGELDVESLERHATAALAEPWDFSAGSSAGSSLSSAPWS